MSLNLFLGYRMVTASISPEIFYSVNKCKQNRINEKVLMNKSAKIA